MSERAKAEPTHVLHVNVPLELHDGPLPDFDAVADACRTVLSVTRAAYAGFICNDVTVEMETR